MQHMLLHAPHSHSASHSQTVIPSLTITVLKKGILSLVVTRCSSTAHAPTLAAAQLLTLLNMFMHCCSVQLGGTMVTDNTNWNSGDRLHKCAGLAACQQSV